MATTSREPLSRERILEAALAVADRDGPDALSMRRLAQELDVWPMAVYRWFRDKDELVAALGEVAVTRVAAPAAGPWRARLAALLTQARSALAGHAPTDATALRDVALPILADAGLGADEAERTWPALFGLAVGFRGDDRAFAAALELLLDAVEHRT